MDYTGDLRKKDFSGAKLAGSIFRDANLYQASFASADLEGATFSNCFLAEANLERADCDSLRATKSSFYRANFRGAILNRALLWDCVLADADLHGATLSHVTLTLDCNSFEGVRLDHAASAELAYLFSRASSRHQQDLLSIVGERDLPRLERIFAQ